MKDLIRGILKKLGFDLIRTKHSHENLSKHLANVLSSKDIDCIIDVGANSGQYGVFLRALGYKGYIVSFEPVGSVFNRLKEKCQSDEKWICHNLALGDKNEDKLINVYQSTVFSSFLTANDYSKNIWRSLENSTSETVKVVKLDDVFADLIGKLNFSNCMLKLDTQGYDKQAFDGAKASLKHIAALQSELSLISVYDNMPDVYDVLKEYNRHNFHISGMYPINRDESMAVIEYDCVMVKV